MNRAKENGDGREYDSDACWRDFQIVSGGQTGVDQAALQVAIELNIPHGGWCPKGRRSESGRIPSRFHLKEANSRNYADRTELNVVDSDATLILFRDKLVGGTLLTKRLVEKHRKPHLVVDLLSPPDVQLVREWLCEVNPQRLNIAGPRESTSRGITVQAMEFLTRLFDAREFFMPGGTDSVTGRIEQDDSGKRSARNSSSIEKGVG